MLNLNFNPFPVLTTERLVLRELTMNDAQALADLRSIEEMNLYIDRDKVLSLEGAQQRIDTLHTYLVNGTGITWAVCLKDNPQLIGTTCLFGFNKEHLTAELGYELHPTYQGKGLMVEAIKVMMDYAADVINAKCVDAIVKPANEKSIALIKRFGFIRDEEARQRIGSKAIEEFDVYTRRF